MARPSFRRTLYLVTFAAAVLALIWVRAFRPLEHRAPRPTPHSSPANF